MAEVEQRMGDRFLLVTQNVDGLHHRAGSQRVIELHGGLFRSKCSRCQRPPFQDEREYSAGSLPECELCAEAGVKGLLRPDIVWFGEALNPEHLERVTEFAARARAGQLVFLAVGTSGSAYPAAGLVDVARTARASTWLVNADQAENSGKFDHFVRGRSAELLPVLLGR